MNVKDLIFELTDSTGIGNIRDAAKTAAKYFAGFCEMTYTDNRGFIAKIKGESDYTLALEAHIDQIGFTVTSVDENGFLTVAACGGIDLRALPARQVVIHGKKEVRGVFCSTPPHLSEKDVTFEKIGDMKIDSCLGKAAKDVISAGDYVTFTGKPFALSGDRVCSKSIDDRAGVAVLIEIANRFKNEKPPVNLAFCLSDMEEIGLRGAKTSAFALSPDEAVAVDVSFGDGPDIKPDKCGKTGRGAMIGISPVLSKQISDKLIKTAKDNGILYQTEIMGDSTGTDADVISVTKSGVKTGLVSIPLRNMHTDCETVSLSDVKSVCDLLYSYVKGGGVNG